MKKVLFTVALALIAAVASAQEPNFPMMGGGFGGFGGGFGGFGGQQQTNVNFDEYVAAPEGFDQERDGIKKGTVKLIEYQSESVGTTRKANVTFSSFNLNPNFRPVAVGTHRRIQFDKRHFGISRHWKLV